MTNEIKLINHKGVIMKVIKKGSIKPTWKHRIICTGSGNGGGGCGANLEIHLEDVYMTRSYHYDGSSDGHYTIMCPVCKTETDIKAPPDSAPNKKEWLKKQNKINKPKPLSIVEVADFPKKGIMFKDISPLLANPEEFGNIIKYLASKWGGKVDKIGGFDARGFIFASALAYEMKLPFFMLRKKGKLPGICKEVSYGLEYGSASLEVQVDAVKEGERVLLIDDILATGGTSLAGCQLVESLEAKITGLQFIIELQDLPGRQKLYSYDVHSIVSC